MALDFQLISLIFNWSFINSSQSGLAFTLKNSGLRFTEFFIRKIVNPRLIVEIEAWWTLLQWGSENQTSYVFEWSKRGWMPNGPVFKCHLNTGQPDHLITGQMDAILFLMYWSSKNFKKFSIQLFPVFEWSESRSPLYLHFTTFGVKYIFWPILKM